MNLNTSSAAQSEVAVWHRERVGSREGEWELGVVEQREQVGGSYVFAQVQCKRKKEICIRIVHVRACRCTCLQAPEVHKCKREKYSELAEGT